MSGKLDYLGRLFQRTSKKRIEHYVITRIWHRLNDESLQMAPQQFVNRSEGIYALSDLYFPQVRLFIEVNEPAHYTDAERIAADAQRKADIEAATGADVVVIDCRGNLASIHGQVDDLVDMIRERVVRAKELQDFRPWDPDLAQSPLYWKQKGLISVSDGVSLKTIEDVCALFDADPAKIKRGYLRKGGIAHPALPGRLIWWPSISSRGGWINEFDEQAGVLTEMNKKPAKLDKHFEDPKSAQQIRYVFLHSTDVLGLTSYRFIGIFRNNTPARAPRKCTVWQRVGTVLQLASNEFS